MHLLNLLGTYKPLLISYDKITNNRMSNNYS